MYGMRGGAVFPGLARVVHTLPAVNRACGGAALRPFFGVTIMSQMNPVASTALLKDQFVTAAKELGVELSVATESERATLIDLAKRAFTDQKKGWEKVDANIRHYVQSDQDLRKRNLVCVVAKVGRHFAGYIFYQLASRGKNESYIKEVGVNPYKQGKGLGTLLMGYAVGEAMDNGRSAVRLYTTSHESYYTNLGFTRAVGGGGYTTDDDTADTTSIAMIGDVKAVAAQLQARLHKLKPIS